MRSQTVVVTCLAVLLAAGAALAGGTVEEVTFYSDALGVDRAAIVYLPEGYDTSDEAYAVVYLIHGHAGTAGNWYSIPEFTDALDQMIGDGLVNPFIFVEPDSSCMPWAPDSPYPFPSHLANSELTGRHEDALVEDLVTWIDSSYRTMVDRDHRFIFGRSAGGYGAARVGLRHPDVFGGLGLQVGMVALEPVQYMIPVLLAEYPAGPPYDFNPFAGSASFMMYSWAAALTPNPSNPNWNVDFIVDDQGNLDADVWNRFVAESPSRWAAEMVAAGGETDIFMDYGDEDPYQIFTTIFSQILTVLEVPHTIHAFHGSHDDPPMWQRLKTHVTYFMPMRATADAPNRVFNPNRWWPMQEFVLELPGDLEAELFDLDTITITAIGGVELDKPLQPLVAHDISDVNGNGQSDLTIWFARWPLRDAMLDAGVDPPGEVAVTLRGETTDALFWEATETLFVPNLGK
jgi:S-formylglutathione hydrolase FrmB